VGYKVLRLPRLRPSCEVGRRPDDCHAHVRPYTHRDHVLRHLVAEPDAGVVALGNDVDQAVVNGELYLDVGVVGQQLREGGPEDRLCRMLSSRDADRAGGLFPQLAQRGQLRADVLQRRAEGAEQPLARLGGRDAPRCSSEETHA
jgi:hypothetical protein